MRLRFTGHLPPGIGAKDLILHAIGKLGTDAGRGYAIEYAGPPIAAMDMEQRFTICNLSIELGAKIGMIAPDDTTLHYLAGRAFAPRGREFENASRVWRQLSSDPDAHFDREYTIEADDVAPQITWGTSPQDVISIDGRVPSPEREADLQRRARLQDALSYMGLTPDTPIAGLPVDWVFIGSCANGRLSDLRSAANILRGRKVAASVKAWAVPGSETVKRDAEAEGLDRVFRDAGFEWRAPGCSLCMAANGETVPPGQRAISTSNRNFVGRQGPGARTHLASPAMAAAAAIAGKIVDCRTVQG